MGFCNLIGNEQVKQILQNTVNQQKISHSYMFLGKEGIGKTLFAQEFAKMILCQEKENKPCNKCKSCIEFDADNNPDYIQIRTR